MTPHSNYLDQLFHWGQKEEIDWSKTALLLPHLHLAKSFTQKWKQHITQVSWFPTLYTIPHLLDRLVPMELISEEELHYLFYILTQDLVKEGINRDIPKEGRKFMLWAKKNIDDYQLIHRYQIKPSAYVEVEGVKKESKRFFSLLYERLHHQLNQINKRYDRVWQMCQMMRSKNVPTLPFKRLLIAGFPPLTPLQEKFFTYLNQQVCIDYFWDLDLYYIKDEKQEAGRWFRNRLQSIASESIPYEIGQTSQKIVLQPATTQEQLLQQVVEQLHQWQQAKIPYSSAAILLLDPTYATPLYQRLPIEDVKIEVALDRNLLNRKESQWLIDLIRFHIAYRNISEEGEEACIAFEQLARVAPYTLPKEVGVEVDRILKGRKKNKWDKLQSLYSDSIWRLSMKKQPVHHVAHWLDQLIKSTLQVEDQLVVDLFQEAIERIKNLLSIGRWQWNANLMKQIIRVFQRTKLPGPKSDQGYKVYRWEEAIGIDCTHLLILGATHSHLPTRLPNGSINYPYLGSEGNKMQQDHRGREAYCFYRLLQKQRHVTIHYQDSAEYDPSIFIQQLRYELPHWIVEHKRSMPTPLPSREVMPITIVKSKEIQKKLDNYLCQGAHVPPSTLSPAAINSYLNCPLQFYFKYIAKITKPTEKKEASELVGELVHAVMEQIYTPYIGEKISKGRVRRFIRQAQSAVDDVATQFKPWGGVWKRVGKRLLAVEATTLLVKKLLNRDLQRAPFTIWATELGRDKKEPLSFTFDVGKSVYLIGIADRIEKKEDEISVVDYKTSLWQPRISTISSLFDETLTQRNSSALQVIWYSWLYGQVKNWGSLSPRIVSTRTESSELPLIQNQQGVFQPITTDGGYQNLFTKELAQLFRKIFDPDEPFTQTKDKRKCLFCVYRTICQR